MQQHSERKHAPASTHIAEMQRQEYLQHHVAEPDGSDLRVRPAVAENERPVSARRKRDARTVIADELAQHKTIEHIREEALHDLEAVNELLETLHDAPRQQRVERAHKKEIEALLAAIEERRRPAVAYHDARTQYEAALAAYTQHDEEDRDDLMEQVWFWRGQTDVHGQRMAEEEVAHDIRTSNIDAYRRQLEVQYQTLAEHESTYDESSAELLDMAILQQKIAVLAAHMESPELQRRLHVERERQTLSRAAERIDYAITRTETEHKTLNWLNPLHWRRMKNVNDRLAHLRHERENLRIRLQIPAMTLHEP